jgi:hypothetical protein
LSENITTMVKSSATRVIGLMLRDELGVSYQSLLLSLISEHAGDEPASERDAEVDETLLAISPMVISTPRPAGRARSAAPCEDVGVDREEEHLEDRVEGDQPRAVLGVALGQVVPDDDHRDAAGETDHDQPEHVLGLVAQEEHGQAEHQDRAEDPVLKSDRPSTLRVAEDWAHLLVADLGQRRVHHQDEPDGDGDRSSCRRSSRLSAAVKPGATKPSATPRAIARKIHSVR